MTKDTFEQEVRLRRLFADLLIKKGYEKEVYLLDLSAFFKSHQIYTLFDVQALWKEHLEGAGSEGGYFSLYVHIPFCRSRCSFCRHYEWTCSGDVQLEHYVESLIFEIRAFKDIFSGVKFKSLYFGGGTANILSPEQIKRLMSEVDQSFEFDGRSEKTFECNPNESSLEKLAIFADHGINRVSFGVQSCEEDILNSTYRAYQDDQMVASAIQDAQKFPAFHKVNTDLLIGLHNDSPQTVCDSFLKLAELGCDSISVYALKPPLHYIKNYYDGRQDLYEQVLAEKLVRFEELVKPIAERFDYVFIPLKDMKQNFDAWMFTLKKHYQAERPYKYVTAEFPIDCLGIGTGAVSTIMNRAFYKNQSFLPFQNEGTHIREGRYRGCLRYAPNDQRVFFVLGEIATWNKISILQYQNMFGSDIRDDFKGELAKLVEMEAVAVDEKFVRLIKNRPDERFFYALFFLSNQEIFDGLDKLKTKV